MERPLHYHIQYRNDIGGGGFMGIFDLHCDVLEKLTKYEDANFRDDKRIQANLTNLLIGKVKVQVFAIFIHPDVPEKWKFFMAAKQIEAFHTKVLTEPEMVHITEWEQLNTLEEGQIGAVLSLEGCDCIGNDIEKLKHILNAGVKLVGLTWNYENAVAYGAEEDPTKGLKPFAQTVISLLNERDIIIDVSHLNEKGFYDVLPLAKNIIASHSNSGAICNHPRNLTDEQVKALVEYGGRMHVVFYPPFIKQDSEEVTIDQLIKHILHLSSLVGIEHIGFGSDFDGMDPLAVKDLANAAQYQNLIHELLKYFSDEEVYEMSYRGISKYVLNIRKREA